MKFSMLLMEAAVRFLSIKMAN